MLFITIVLLSNPYLLYLIFHSFYNIIKNIHFSIPIYQRRYEWKSEQWERLWENVIEQTNIDRKNKNIPVFLGSIALKFIEDKGGNVKYEIIDGQQRATREWKSGCRRETYNGNTPEAVNRCIMQGQTNS